MAEQRARPLSPHLGIWRWGPGMTASIFHRISGGALTVAGLAVLTWWLLSLATGGDSYADAAECLSSPLGKLFLFGFTLSLAYHLFNGVRHLLWDAGWGFEIPEFYASGWTVAALSVVFTLIIWIVGSGAVA